MIVTSPAFVLSTRATRVQDFDDPAVADTIAKLFQAFSKEKNAVGVAAPQVGVGLAICLVAYPHDKPKQILINPEILNQSSKKILDIEGCLSIPNKAYFVSSPDWVEVVYQDENGGTHEVRADGFYARVLRHEIDHLNGCIISDHGQMVDGAISELVIGKPDRMKR